MGKFLFVYDTNTTKGVLEPCNEIRNLFLVFLIIYANAFSVSLPDSGQTVFHVHFKFNSSKIEANENLKLPSFAKELSSSHKYYKIRLSGYCDAVGGNSYNDQLSVLRANTVKSYIISLGINPSQIIETKGYGKRKPLNGNKTEKERQANRRVDITVDLEAGKKDETGKTIYIQGLSKLGLDSAKDGTHIILRDLDFIGGSHHLFPDFLTELDSLVSIMQSHPKLKIRILGYVCCTEGGKDGMDLESLTYNLSSNRAKSVYEYLIEHKIDQDRLSYQGMGGKNKLVSPEITEADKTKNRRVEIVVVE